MGREKTGRIAIVALLGLNTLFWLAAPPEGDGRSELTRQSFGEFIGSTVVILFSIALLMATRARWLEPWFGGLDKMYRVHRQIGMIGFGLLALHVALIPWRLTSDGGVPTGLLAFIGFAVMVALSIGPRLPVLHRVFAISYGRWRLTHRMIGLFFIISLAHALLVDAVLHTAPLPFALVMVAYVVGILAFLYTQLLARFVRQRRPYLVDAVHRLNQATVEISFRPRKGRSLRYRSGQFVFVTFRRRGLREPHPFTVSSAPHESRLRLTIKAAGDFTRRLHESVEPDMRVTIEGSYGLMDFRRGTRDQIWIAGGIGITPFLSWCRDLNQGTRHRADLFYAVRTPDDTLFMDEIETIAQRNPNLHVHLHLSSRMGRLSVPRITSEARGGLPGKDVYMCGPVPMVKALERELLAAGVAAPSIHFEEFSFR